MFSWSAFLAYAYIATITPGPNNLMSWGNGMRRGFFRALPFNFGVLAGFLIVMLACALVSTALAEVLPAVLLPMRILGAGYLAWLAWTVWRSTGSAAASERSAEFRTGFFLQFVNVKIYFYGVIAMQNFVLPAYQGEHAAVALFAALLALIGFLNTLCWSAFGTLFEALFRTHAKLLNGIMAAGLLWCAAAVLFAEVH